MALHIILSQLVTTSDRMQDSHLGDGQYRGKESHRRCNCMRPAKHIRVKTKYYVCVVVEVYARKDESPPPMLKPLPALTWGWWLNNPFLPEGGFGRVFCSRYRVKFDKYN
jgi:hypothetical protein